MSSAFPLYQLASPQLPNNLVHCWSHSVTRPLNMESTNPSETSTKIYIFTRCHIQDKLPINPLKTKCRLLYLKTQSVPRC